MRIFYLTNAPWKVSQRKKKNQLEKGGISSETEMDKTPEENDVGEVETDERVKEKKSKAF